MKPWYRSKTIWFNGVIAVLGVLSSSLDALKVFVTPEHFGLLGLAVAAVNVFLRSVTTQGLSTDKE